VGCATAHFSKNEKWGTLVFVSASTDCPRYTCLSEKVATRPEELYRFMVEQFHQSRAFVLELMVVIILIIDLIWLFKGSTPI
jgi:hypothetical protein